MKILIIKHDGMLSDDVKRRNMKDLVECIRAGCLFIDGSLTYEVVEFDSIDYDDRHISNLTRREILNQHERLNQIRKAFRDRTNKKVEEAEKND